MNEVILVVDDDRLNRLMLSANLKKTGYSVETASDGQQALDILAAKEVDAVLLDLLMPGVDGYQVLEYMKEDERLAHGCRQGEVWSGRLGEQVESGCPIKHGKGQGDGQHLDPLAHRGWIGTGVEVGA